MITKLLFSTHHLLRWIMFIAYLLLIVYASLTPPDNIPKLINLPHLDKVVHFMMYFGFCLLILWSMDPGKIIKHKPQKRTKKRLLIYPFGLFIAICWGILMEYFQKSMHLGRSYSELDMIANITGAIAGTLLFLYYSERQYHLY